MPDLNPTISRGAALYERERDLPKLIPVSGEETTADIVERLQKAFQGAQNAIRKGHWTADGNRGVALRMALQAETAALEAERTEEAA